MVAFTKVSPDELVMLKKREALKHPLSRKDWALEVLELVQANPHEWLRLEGEHNAPNATRYLKPLGIKYLLTEVERKGYATIFVKWD